MEIYSEFSEKKLSHTTDSKINICVSNISVSNGLKNTDVLGISPFFSEEKTVEIRNQRRAHMTSSTRMHQELQFK